MLKTILITIDIGNSAIKIFDGSTLQRIGYTDKWQDTVMEYIALHAHAIQAVAVSSVAPEKELWLREFLTAHTSIPIFDSLALIESYTDVDFSGIQGMGTDRKLGLIGARTHAEQGAIITVDCGTAVTINVLNRHNRCLGGAILPGFQTQAKALHEYTGLLPLIQPTVPLTIPSVSTESAMQTGIVAGIQGGVKYIIEQYLIVLGNTPVHIYCTGGNAYLLTEALQLFFGHSAYLPNLVSEGLFKVFTTGLQNIDHR